ncbi:PqqD family protein [Pseudodesulfovibrio hydrargyri]|nr:PqqD family protein [Pseudodesulfovibrio hydrargyri]
MFRKKRPEPTISRAEALRMVPMRNEAVAVTELPEGLVRLAYPLAVKPWFGRLADKVGLWDGSPMTKTVELDEMGTFVWRHIDGERSVRDIAEAFAETYQVQPRESELAVTAFIKTIGQRGIIGLK